MGDITIADAHSRENAHKLGFLANEYAGKSITELAEFFQMGPLDFNVAVWRAQDMGFITVDSKDGKVTFHENLGKWIFGEETDRLISAIPYAIAKLNEDEADMEEQYMINWASGHRLHDYLVAIKWLLNEGIIASYEIENTTVIPPSKKGKKRGKQTKKTVDKYTFYTLPLNEKHHWGLKQFEDQDRVRVVEKGE